METNLREGSTNIYAEGNRLEKAFRIVDLLAEIGITTRVEAEGLTDDQWDQACQVDFDRRQAVKPTKTKFSGASQRLVSVVLSLLGSDDSDPFEGLNG